MAPVPKREDFPASLTLAITPPDTARSTNILILLHGIGDTLTPFANFASALHLPETTCITIQAPKPVPFELPGYHWGDDIVFEGDSLDSDPGFTTSTRLLVRDVITDTLIDKLGYQGRQILIFGYGQGASLALSAALDFHRSDGRVTQVEESAGASVRTKCELGGVVAVGGVLPLSAIREQGRRDNKCRTPAIILGGYGAESAVSDVGTTRTKGKFEYVEVVRWRSKRGDTMPRNREEMLPIMQFFARRLRSTSGVPDGSIEIS